MQARKGFFEVLFLVEPCGEVAMKEIFTRLLSLSVLLIAVANLISGCSKSNPTGPTTGTITGTVTDASTNNPISSAAVTVGSLSATTSPQGSYSFSNVPSGTDTVTVTATGYASQSKQVQVSSGVSATLNFQMQPAATTVSGTVTDATTNTTIAGATVTLGSQSTTTSSAGSYSFSNVQAGTYTVSAVASGYNPSSEQIQVSAGVPQTADISLQAMQESVNLGSTLNATYYSWTPFSFDSYTFVQCSNGVMNHNVKVTITINPTANPVTIIVMRPDGKYKFEADSTRAGLKQTFESNACGDWEVIVWNYGNAQTAYSGTVSMDFSDYSVSTNDISSQVQVPVNMSIPANSTDQTLRFMKANMTYQLQLTVSGTVYLSIYNPDNSSALSSQQINTSYSSQTFVATKDGFYAFDYQNKNILSTKSVAGSLLINRGTSSENHSEGQARLNR